MQKWLPKSGAVDAGLDTILPAQILRNLSGPVRKGIVEKVLEESGMAPGLARSVTAGVIKGIPEEGVTEAAQEAINIAAEKFVQDNKDAWGSKEWNRIIESGVKGAVGGGIFGGAGGAFERVRERGEEKRFEAGVQQGISEQQAERQAELDAINTRITENLNIINQPASAEEHAARQADLEEALKEYDSYHQNLQEQQTVEEQAAAEAQQAEWRASLNEKLSTKEGTQEVIKNLNTKATDFPMFNKQEQNQIRTQLQRRIKALETQSEEEQTKAQEAMEKVFAKVRPTPVTELTSETLQRNGFSEKAQKELLGLNLRKKENFQKLVDMANDQRASRASDAVAAAKYIDQLPASITKTKAKPVAATATNQAVKEKLSKEGKDILDVWEANREQEDQASADARKKSGRSKAVEQGAGAGVGVHTKRLGAEVQEAEEPATGGLGGADESTGGRTTGLGRSEEVEPSALIHDPAEPLFKTGKRFTMEDLVADKIENPRLELLDKRIADFDRIYDELLPLDEKLSRMSKPRRVELDRSHKLSKELDEVWQYARSAAGDKFYDPRTQLGRLLDEVKWRPSKENLAALKDHVADLKQRQKPQTKAEEKAEVLPVKQQFKSAQEAFDSLSADVKYRQLGKDMKKRAKEAFEDGYLDAKMATEILNIDRGNKLASTQKAKEEDTEDLEQIKTKAKNTIGRGVRKVTKATAGIAPEEDVTLGEVLSALADLMYVYIKQGARSMKQAIQMARKEMGAAAANITHSQMVDAYNTASDRHSEEQQTKRVATSEPHQQMDFVEKTINALPGASKGIAQSAANVVSTLPDVIQNNVMSIFGLAQKFDMFGRELPSIKTLEKAIELRDGKFMEKQHEIKKVLDKGYALIKKYGVETLNKFNAIAMETTSTQTEVLDSKDADRNTRLYKQFKALPEEYQKLYAEIRAKYDEMADAYLTTITESLSDRSAARKLREQFETGRLKVYLPMMRYGEYWLEYTTPQGERSVEAFESPAQRDRVRALLAREGNSGFRDYARLSQIAATREQLPSGFMSQLVDMMHREGVSQDVIDNAYQAYLSLFPAQSVRQQFRYREGVAGYSLDVLQGFANVGTRMARQLTHLEYNPQIDDAVNKITQEAGPTPTTTIANVVGDIKKETAYLKNPEHTWLSNKASYWTYFNYIVGNVSSALINLTNLPIMTYSVLGGEFGFGKAASAMQRASSLYLNGGLNEQGDWTASTRADAEIKKLLDVARSRAAIGRSSGYELVEMMRTKAEDYTGLRAKIEKGLGWVFQNSEQANREIGIISTYLLAKEKGLSTEAAIEKALHTSTLVNGSALSETGPRLFQQGLGRVLFIFKRFAQAQMYMATRLTYQAFKGESPEVRRMAIKQLMGIFGTSFAFAGVQGMPFIGGGAAMYGMLQAMLGDDDEPYDVDDALEQALGSMAYRGPVNEMMNIDVASRTGFGNLFWRDDSRRLAEVGPVVYTFERFAGPAYSLGLNYQRSYGLFQEGHTERALEAALPSFMRNVLKAGRFATEGATNLDGVPIVEDVSLYNATMQLMGFSNAELTEAYARAGARKTAEKAIMDRRTALLNLAYLARTNGDTEGMQDVQDKIDAFNDKFPMKGVAIHGDTLSRSFKGHQQRNKEMIDGVRLNPKLKDYLVENYGEEDED